MLRGDYDRTQFTHLSTTLNGLGGGLLSMCRTDALRRDVGNSWIDECMDFMGKKHKIDAKQLNCCS